MGDKLSEFRMNIKNSELITVSSVIIILHLILWWRYLPLAHQDLNFHTEPGLNLATYGIITGSGSQHIDLTYVKGMYFYPPGYSLIIGSWIKLFGSSVHSLLACTHLTHTGYLFTLWVLLRRRFKCTRLAAALAVISSFPMFHHGRPDVTALLLGAIALLIIPHKINLCLLLLSGSILGIAVLVSPPYGISAAAVVVAFYLFASKLPLTKNLKGLALITVSSVFSFIGIWAAVITWQNSWALGIEKFRVNSANRAYELNQMPDFFTSYMFVFSVLPLFLLTLIPLIIVLCRYRFSLNNSLPIAARAISF